MILLCAHPSGKIAWDHDNNRRGHVQAQAGRSCLANSCITYNLLLLTVCYCSLLLRLHDMHGNSGCTSDCLSVGRPNCISGG